MRIAISTSVIQRGKTGIAQYVFALVRALLAHADKHEFHLLVLEEDMPLFAFAKDRMKLVAVEEKFRPAVKNILWHQRVLPKWLKENRMDVIHVPSYRRLMWSAPCARVATIHDLAPFHVKGKYDPLRMFYGRVIVRRLARRQDAVISISTNTAKDIETFFGVPVSEQNIILNGLEHNRFQPGDPVAARAAVAERWKLEAPFFLYISRLEHPAKNHVRLIQAYDRFRTAGGPSWPLALGGGDWHGSEAIKDAARASAYSADIRFLGFVPDAELPMLYHAAGAMVYPSLFEGFGLPPVEAMACGCPVVSSTKGSLDEVVADAAERIDPEDVAGLAEALSKVSGNEALRARLIAVGLANARRFNWDDNAVRVLEVYAKAVARRKG